MEHGCPTHFGVSFMPPAFFLPYIIRRNKAANTIVPVNPSTAPFYRPQALRHRRNPRPSSPMHKGHYLWQRARIRQKARGIRPCPIQMEAQTTLPAAPSLLRNGTSGGLRPRNREKYRLLSEFTCHNHSITAQKSQAPPRSPCSVWWDFCPSPRGFHDLYANCFSRVPPLFPKPSFLPFSPSDFALPECQFHLPKNIFYRAYYAIFP